MQLHPGAKGGTLTARAREADAVDCPLPLGGLTVHTPLTLQAAGASATAPARLAWILHFRVRRPLHQRLASALRRRLRRFVTPR